MLRSDIGLQPSAEALSLMQDIGRIALPTGTPGPQGFSSLFTQVHDEVSDFIQNGSSSGFTEPALNAEGWALRQRLQQDPAASPMAATVLEEAGASSPASGTEAQQDFLTSITPWARQTAERLGVEPHLVAAHAALESGWGQKPLRQADGRDTHNLFSLKAGSRWSGDSASAATTEFVQGQARHQNERFRSYPDHASAFQDYAQLLLDNPRFKGALNTGGDARAFAQGLARGGYATDPAYADKLARVAEQVKAQVQGATARPLQSRD